MEMEKMIELIDAVSKSDLTGFKYEEDGIKLHLSKKENTCYVTENVSAPVNMTGTASAGVVSAEMGKTNAEGDQTLGAAAEEAVVGNIVESPLVGTFYSAPAEDAESFVKVGDRVEKGQTLEYWISDTTAELVQSLEGKETPSVYLAGNSALLQTAGPEMYQSTLIEHAGGVNAASEITDTYWADTSYEQILSWNPDYIILAADADYDVDSVLNDSALADCTAIKEGHVYQIPSDIEALDSPVPASFLGSYYVASILHPDVVTEDDFKTTEKNFYETFYDFTPESAN